MYWTKGDFYWLKLTYEWPKHYEENILVSLKWYSDINTMDLENIMEASDMNIRNRLYRNSNSKK